MLLFLSTFFLLYGGLHFYIFMKIRSALSLGTTMNVCLTAFMVIMIFTPFLQFWVERAGAEPVARVVAYAGFTWMGMVFIFFTTSLAIDLFRLMVYLAGAASRKDLSVIVSAHGWFFALSCLVCFSVVAYGCYEAGSIRTEKITLRTDKIPRSVGTLRIAQISDIHLGMIVREKRLAKIIDEVRKADPHMVISTGDLVDGQLDRIDTLADPLRGIQPRYGKFAITGNHEFFAGIARTVAFTEKAGFRMLRDEAVTIPKVLTLVGIDDPGRGYSPQRLVAEEGLLKGLPKGQFVLLLKHRPLVNNKSLGLFDLQLSGHTHKGQIFPFRYAVSLSFPYYAGFYDLGRGSGLYVSRGSGTWGPPIRFLAPPEVTVIEIIPQGE